MSFLNICTQRVFCDFTNYSKYSLRKVNDIMHAFNIKSFWHFFMNWMTMTIINHFNTNKYIFFFWCKIFSIIIDNFCFFVVSGYRLFFLHICMLLISFFFYYCYSYNCFHYLYHYFFITACYFYIIFPHCIFF